MALHLPRKSIPLGSLSLALDDVARIFERLLGHVNEQADIEMGNLVRPEHQTEDDFEREKIQLRERAFRITVTISGKGGESLFGDDVDVFHSPNLPERISSIYMTNATAYHGVVGRRPMNAFELYLDFSKPPLLDGQNPVSSPTPNSSALTVEGDRDAWVAAVSDAVLGVTQHRKTRRAWIHKAFVYDLGLLLFGFPFGLYVCWKLSGVVGEHLGSIHPVLSGAAYLYIVIVVAWGYRILFGYTKWAFPTLELANNRDAPGKHRAFWYAIMLVLIGNVLWEIVT